MVGKYTRLVHLHVEDTSEELLAPALLCHKEPARRIQSPLLGALERKIPLGGYFACSSLVLYGKRDRWLPCTERSYYGAPLCHKEPARSKAPSRGLWMRRAGSLWHKRAGVAIPRMCPPHRGGELWDCLQSN